MLWRRKSQEWATLGRRPLKPVDVWKNAGSQEGMRWSGGRAGGVWIPALQGLEMGHTGSSRAGYGAADGTLGCQGGG